MSSRCVINLLKSLKKIDDIQLVESISTISEDERTNLECTLKKLNSNVIFEEDETEPTKIDEKKEQKLVNDEKFIRKLRVNLEAVHERGIALQSDLTPNIVQILNWNFMDASYSQDYIIESLRQLVSLNETLDVIQSIVRFQMGQAICALKKSGMDDANISNIVGILPSQLNTILYYSKFVSRFPCLLFSGFSSTTILRYQKIIKQRAEIDSAFEALLALNMQAVTLPNGVVQPLAWAPELEHEDYFDTSQ